MNWIITGRKLKASPCGFGDWWTWLNSLPGGCILRTAGFCLHQRFRLPSASKQGAVFFLSLFVLPLQVCPCGLALVAFEKPHIYTWSHPTVMLSSKHKPHTINWEINFFWEISTEVPCLFIGITFKKSNTHLSKVRSHTQGGQDFVLFCF
jgi:hypothetical protein